MPPHRTAFALILSGAVAISAASLLAQSDSPLSSRSLEWRNYSGDPQGTKYSPLAQIDASNVDDLRVAWRWQTVDRDLQLSNPLLRGSRNEETPLMANGVLYTATPLGLVAALDPATGETRWVHDPKSYEAGRPNNVGFLSRGLAYWTDGGRERILHGTTDAYLLSLDARTGQPDEAFGSGGRVDLTTEVPRAVRATNFSARRPLVAGNVIVVGSSISDGIPTKESPPGYVQAFDVLTGRRLWTFHTVPQPGEFGHDTWDDGSAEYTGNTNVWAGMSYDPELDYIYLPISTPTNDYYGGQRLGHNLFAESLVCIEAKTGRRVWHFQAVHHGLWDYDLPAQPVLGDITVDGRVIQAVIQVSKQGFTYVFDRRTGEPVWPIEERPVRGSSVPGEVASPTQPFPTKPPPFELQGSTVENLMDFTPELRSRAREHLQQFTHGPLFTPPSEQGTLVLPGYFGGADWGGAAFDPETGLLYVPSKMSPTLMRLLPGDPTRTNHRYRMGLSGQESARLVELMTVDGLPLFKPPYSKITAIDMNRGEHSWVSPIGNGPQRHPLLADLDLAPLGDAVAMGPPGFPLVTKTLLFVSMTRLGNNAAASPPPWAEWGDPDANRKVLYAFDKRTGALLREVELAGLSAAAPMTYMRGGVQYIVVATGGGPDSALVALSVGASAEGAGTASGIDSSAFMTAGAGVYTDDQAARGQAAYQQECAACHAENLRGSGFAPALNGESFAERWSTGSVGDLFTVTSVTMPQDRPGGLAIDTYADIVAYMLRVNGYPSGVTPLTPGSDELNTIALDRPDGK